MTTAEWRAKYEKDGCVGLWIEEEFNAGSRLVVRAYVHSAVPAARQNLVNLSRESASS